LSPGLIRVDQFQRIWLVARYYLDIHDGTQIARDDEGSEFDSLDAAVRAATRSAAEIGTNEVVRGDPSDIVVVIEVRDEQNQRVCTVTASMTIDWHNPPQPHP
jgi:hypothetical protein